MTDQLPELAEFKAFNELLNLLEQLPPDWLPAVQEHIDHLISADQ